MAASVFINLFVAAIELLAVIEIYRKFNVKAKINKISLFCCGGVYFAYSVIAIFFIDDMYLNLSCHILILISLSFAFKIKIYKTLLINLILAVINIAFEMLAGLLVSLANGITVEAWQSNAGLYLLAVVIAKFLVYLTVKMSLFFIKPERTSTTKLQSAIHLIAAFLSVAILISLSFVVYNTDSNAERIPVMISAVLLVVENISVFIVYEISAKREVKLRHNEIKLEMTEREKQQYKHLIDSQIRSNKQMHDLKNTLFTINRYMENADPKAREIISNICKSVDDTQIVKYTDIADVDALLNAKYIAAKQAGIDVKYKIFGLGEINIDSMHFCILVGNLLDNAIESCVFADEGKRIELRIGIQGDYIKLSMQNTTKNTEVRLAKTTKKDSLSHGFGLIKIKELAEIYDGSLEYHILDGMFNCYVMLKNG